MISAEMVSTTAETLETTTTNKMELDIKENSTKMEVSEDDRMELEPISKKEAVLNDEYDEIDENGVCKSPESLHNGQPNGVISDQEPEAEKEVEMVETKMAIDDNNNNDRSFNIEEQIKRINKVKLLKSEKSLKLKQFQLDLCNEEAKLILLKRLYYSQHIPPSQAQQQRSSMQQNGGPMANKQLMLQQQQRMANQQILNNGNPSGLNPQRSIINKKVFKLAFFFFLVVNLLIIEFGLVNVMQLNQFDILAEFYFFLRN